MPHDMTDFYDSAWNNWKEMIRYSPAPRIRRKRILSYLQKLNFDSLLDVGCGNGEFLIEVSRAFNGTKLTGCDLSHATVKSNRNNLPQVEFHTLDLNETALNQKFDVVVCMEVIEHCSDYQTSIQHLAAMTREHLVISVPCGPLFQIDHMVGHIKHFSPEEIISAIHDAGLEIERIECWGWPFFNLYKRLINLAPDRMSEKFMSSRKYSFPQKIFALMVYASFLISLPFGGYQMFAYTRKHPD